MYSLRGVIGNTVMRCFSLLPLQNKIVFSCFDGKSYGDNPKAIYEECLRSITNCRFIWLMNNEAFSINGSTVVQANSIKSLYHLSTSKIWIDNSRKREWVVKRKKQFYIQTWHAGITVKRVEKDAIDKLPKDYIKCSIHDSKIADLFISGSKWNTKNYRQAFWYNGRILECGLPRSDVFYRNNDELKSDVYGYYHIDEKTHLVLYSPTFRNDGKLDSYNMDYYRLIDSLEKRYGGEWKILVRLHPNIQDRQNIIKYDEKILNGSSYTDINKLIICCEFLITDYSSCMMDALENNKKVIVYATDIRDYLHERGTYFSFQELPFSVATNNKTLEDTVLNFDNEKYTEDCNQFKRNYGIFGNGSACEQVVKEIKTRL